MSQNISWFFIITLWFNINLILLFFFFLFVEATLSNMVWYLIGMIPIGPAIAGMIGATYKVIEEDDFSDPGKDFRKYYKKNFLDSLKLWIPFLLLVYTFSVNINFYFNIITNRNMPLVYVYITLLILLVLFLIPLFLIQTKFSFRLIDLLKLALFYFFSKIKITIGNFFIIFIIIFIVFMTTEWILLALPGILCYVWVLYNYNIIKDVNERFVTK